MEPDDPLGAEPWPVWLSAILPAYCTYPFAAYHCEFWDWVWSIDSGARPEAFVAVWPRGGAKSTSAEAACVALGSRGRRRYGLYVCDTQDRADDHVGNIGSMLESDRVELFYPHMADRLVGKFGNSKGWRRNRLRCANGFTVDAIGLDTAGRGVKLDDQRPDFLVIDDVDGEHDSPDTTRKKIDRITKALIPAGSEDVAVLAVQNLIHRDGVFARLVDGRADFLQRRIVSGPVPAVVGLKISRVDGRDVITAGEATWAGQSIERCNEMIADMGARAFVAECQHEVGEVEGSLWATDQIAAGRCAQPPDIDVLVVAVDPSGGSGPSNDAQGILAVGRGVDRHGYVLEDQTCSLSPMGWGKRAVMLAVELQADRIVAEKNYGGDMVASTVHVAADALVAEGVVGAARFATGSSGVKLVSASQGKKIRAQPVAALYGEKERPETWSDATMHHVGHLTELEAEMTGWDPDGRAQSPNRLDALVWAATDLGIAGFREPGGAKLVERW